MPRRAWQRQLPPARRTGPTRRLLRRTSLVLRRRLPRSTSELAQRPRETLRVAWIAVLVHESENALQVVRVVAGGQDRRAERDHPGSIVASGHDHRNLCADGNVVEAALPVGRRPAGALRREDEQHPSRPAIISTVCSITPLGLVRSIGTGRPTPGRRPAAR